MASLIVILLLLIFSLNFSLSLSVSTLGSLEYLLYLYGLPSGIFPENVKDFTLNGDNTLEVQLEEPCLTEFETMVYFRRVIRGTLSHRKLLDMNGLFDKELFIWLPIKSVIANYPSVGLATMDISVANKTLSMLELDKPPSCLNLEGNAGQAEPLEINGREEVEVVWSSKTKKFSV